MKVAVSSTGKSLDAPVDPRLGRADYLLIVDTDTGALVEIIDNLSAREAAHGAGINAASRIAEAGAEAILTGRVGPKAAAVCQKAGIVMISDVSGTVREAVNRFKLGQQNQTVSRAEPEETFAGRLPDGQMGQGSGRGLGGGRRGCGGGGQGRGMCRRK
ncbi:MAG: NifB/NifX family molybdenum-iron cluster-binding protein [Desulfobulbaceae bacterium]|nr:NifB/NifX family molybdenum-iron cluster-binding protein [Desulfobulbaceae bacterium]